MTTLREAAQQALEALKMMRDEYEEYACPACDHADAAIYALRSALAESREHVTDDSPCWCNPDPNPEQQKPMRFNCTVIDDAHLNGVPLSQWGKQHEMQPCAGRNCGSTNPNLHSAECFEDYEKATGMRVWQGLTDGEIDALAIDKDGLPNSHLKFARAIERAHGIGEQQ